MNYFSQFWDENREDEYASWGTSTWLFETNESDVILKQITVYNNEKVLKYSPEKLSDKFGSLSDQNLTIDDCDGEVISKEDFYKVW
ncbi:MAG: hypothetical protein HOC83_04795 [Polaribacter sp.]|nr:hypothetical protein [Polaribacter sp.]